MNPLRFRLLPKERNTKFLPPLSARLAAAALLCAFSAHAAPPTPMKAIDEFLKANEKCKEALDDKHSIYAKDHKTLKSTYDPDQQCMKNTGDEGLSYNAQVVDKATDLAKLRRPFAQGSYAIHQLGACRLAYGGMKDVFDKFASMREAYCKDVGVLLQKVKDCGAGPDDKDCADDWANLRRAQRDYVHEIDESAAEANDFLDALARTTHTAAEAYRADFNRLDPLFGARAPASAKKPTDSIPDAPDLKPANGNKDSQATNTLQAYYGLLRTPASVSAITADKLPATPADLIAEEDVASARVNRFKSLLQEPLAAYKGQATGLGHYVGGLIDKQGDPSKNTSFTKKLATYAPGITGIADPAAKLFNNSSGQGAGPAGSGGDSHAGLGEVAAAAGLGAVVAKSLASTGGSGSSQEAPAAPLNPGKGEGPAAAVTNDPASPDSHAGGGAGGKGDTSPAGPTAPGTKAEANPPESPATFSVGGSGGAQGGSSRMLAGKYAGPVTAAAPATGVVQGGAAGPELGSSFTSNLEPHSAPRATPQSVGGEVANLLGQMKNLFNFDEAPAPGGGPIGGAPMPGGGPPDVAGGPTPLLGGGDMPGGGPESAAAEASASAEAGAEPGAAGVPQLDAVRGSPFGRLDTTLFERVHARHHRCMERGQILYGLKERVE